MEKWMNYGGIAGNHGGINKELMEFNGEFTKESKKKLRSPTKLY